MKAERLHQVSPVFRQAVEVPPGERAAFLDAACSGDAALRRDVERLISAHERAGSFIEAPAYERAAGLLADKSSAPAVGQLVGHYIIVAPLGKGGMGEVYLADDAKLERSVALKMLPSDVASNEERMRRFTQEAKAAATLNHPNIAHIYEVGDDNGVSFIAMEHVEGQALDATIGGRPLDTTQIIWIGIQIADALDEAHAKGITHRDIKPLNIMITPRGAVKVLDFGIAKVVRPADKALPASDLATLVKTSPGMVMGTVQYMSPEQALGREIDHRTDIFSLGVVLYEMATGRLPFSGATASETIDRITHAQPEAIARFNYNVPAELERVVRKCLEKDRERRYQSARELQVDLENLKRDSDSSAVIAEKVTTQQRSKVSRLTFAGIALAILALVCAGFYLVNQRDKAAGKIIDSIAVLPLANESADPDTEYLSDGITESLINSLSQLSRLKVMARSTVFRYKNREVDPQKVGNELGVNAVLMGKVLQRGDTLVIQADLVRVADGSQIWGERYNRKTSDILAVQEEISREISERLRLRLTGEEQKRVTKRYTDNTEAYQLYLQGRFHWNKFTGSGVNKSIEYFNQAIELDPSYSLAYTGLAAAYTVLGVNHRPAKEAHPKAKAAVMKALEIDETLAEAHALLGAHKMFYEWDWPGCEREFKRAIELNANLAENYELYSYYLQAMGRTEEAVEMSKRAQQLEPLSLVINTDLARAYTFARQYDEAIKQYRKAIELYPNAGLGHLNLALAYELNGMQDEAVAEYLTAISGAPAEEITALRDAYSTLGWKGFWRKRLDILKKESEQRYISPLRVAQIYIRLGEKDQALEWLEKGHEERTSWLIDLKSSPIYDSLRAEPRFQRLLRRVGLTP